MHGFEVPTVRHTNVEMMTECNAPSSAEPTEQATIASRIIANLAVPARDAQVADVRIGLGYTAVMLMDNRVGVAYTFRNEAGGGCSVFHALRPLVGRQAAELLVLLESSDPIEAGVGLACANALANGPEEGFLDGNILEHLDIRPADQVGMVGHFEPMVKTLRDRARSLVVFERERKPRGETRPTEEAGGILPHCQVALVTATSIINHTIDEILQSAGNCREVAILGASTPMLPDVFSSVNVTMLSGIVGEKVTDVLRIVSEGGGMRQFSPYVRKVCLRTVSSRIG